MGIVALPDTWPVDGGFAQGAGTTALSSWRDARASLRIICSNRRMKVRCWEALIRSWLSESTRAAWALRDHVSLESTAGKELLHSLDLNADRPSGQMQLGQFNYARGNLPKAVEHMHRAIAWDPNSPPFHHDLAMIESIAGDTQSSIASLQEAIRLNPN